MKPILENWNKFLNEFWYSDVALEDGGAELPKKKKIKIKLNEGMFGGEGMSEDGSQPEDKYFGRIVKIANQIKQIHSKFLQDLEKMFQRPQSSFIQYIRPLTVDNVNNEIQFFADEVEKQTNAKLIGCGKFRCVFDINDDYVIKIDVTPRGSAKDQNETDAKLGREGYGDLFAKSYLADKDHSWVILEKVKPFKRSDLYDFISYFPNKNIDLKNYPAFHYALVVISFTYHKGYKAVAQRKLDEIIKAKKIQIPNNLPDLDILADGFTQSNPYDKIVRVITELGIRPEEVRALNTGKGVDGRFVIIDSSLEEEIRKGFEEPSATPVAASAKPKAVLAGTTMKVD
jgi:hypothetical protein